MKQVCPIELCYGCGVCIDVCNHGAIDWQENEEGFEYPRIDQSKCVNCGLCAYKCPANKTFINVHSLETKKIYAAYSLKYQRKGSSGGMFSAFASSILNKNGIVYGAAYDENLQLKQTAVKQERNLKILQGSKYSKSQSYKSFLDVKNYLKEGISILYCGTPCQIAGLLEFIPKQLQTNLYTLDIICHGVPSQRAFDRVVSYMEGLYGKATNFVYRLLECQSTTPFIVINHKRHYLNGISYSYMRAFYKGLLFRPSCYRCQFSSMLRPGDITLGDFWGVKNFKGKRQVNGVSLVILNTSKGQFLWNNIKDSLYYEERSESDAVPSQHNLQKPSVYPKGRDDSAKDILKMSLSDFARKYHLLPKYPIIEKLKIFIKAVLIKMDIFKYVSSKD